MPSFADLADLTATAREHTAMAETPIPAVPRFVRLDSPAHPKGKAAAAERLVIVIEAPGKVARWRALTEKLGLNARILATKGHFRRHPDTLFPLGLVRTATGLHEPNRQPTHDAEKRLIGPLMAAIQDGRTIIVATDPDIEGDVIADDIRQTLADHPEMTAASPALWRCWVRSLTLDGVRRGLANRHRLAASVSRTAAIPGRTRALCDRLISSTFTQKGTPVGRVFTPLLSALGQARTDQAIGEVRFCARAIDGGRPFMAILPVTAPTLGSLRPLIALAETWRGHTLPLGIQRWRSAGAAVVERFGSQPCYAMNDALIASSRYCHLPADRTERALQRLYQNGDISYPRTDERGISSEAATGIATLARAAGVAGFDRSAAAFDPNPEAEGLRGGHEGIHPIPADTHPGLQRQADMIRAPLPGRSLADLAPGVARDDADDAAVFALVARRAIEAGLERPLQRGVCVSQPAPAGLTDADHERLADLDWQREAGVQTPWRRIDQTGYDAWPLDGQIVEAASDLALGRPSTFGAHARHLGAGGFLQLDPDHIPRLTPAGRDALTASPTDLCASAAPRAIHNALKAAAVQAEAIAKRLIQSSDGKDTDDLSPIPGEPFRMADLANWGSIQDRMLHSIQAALEPTPELRSAIDESLGPGTATTAMEAAIAHQTAATCPSVPELSILPVDRGVTRRRIESLDQKVRQGTAARLVSAKGAAALVGSVRQPPTSTTPAEASDGRPLHIDRYAGRDADLLVARPADADPDVGPVDVGPVDARSVDGGPIPNGKPAGWLGALVIGHSQAEGEDFGPVLIHVRPDHRSRGIARKLALHALLTAPENEQLLAHPAGAWDRDLTQIVRTDVPPEWVFPAQDILASACRTAQAALSRIPERPDRAAATPRSDAFTLDLQSVRKRFGEPEDPSGGTEWSPQ